jgi:hypothetical protein
MAASDGRTADAPVPDRSHSEFAGKNRALSFFRTDSWNPAVQDTRVLDWMRDRGVEKQTVDRMVGNPGRRARFWTPPPAAPLPVDAGNLPAPNSTGGGEILDSGGGPPGASYRSCAVGPRRPDGAAPLFGMVSGLSPFNTGHPISRTASFNDFGDSTAPRTSARNLAETMPLAGPGRASSLLRIHRDRGRDRDFALTPAFRGSCQPDN